MLWDSWWFQLANHGQIGSNPTGKGGWAGILQGSNLGGGAAMPNHLMLLAWPTGTDNQIATSFRYATYAALPNNRVLVLIFSQLIFDAIGVPWKCKPHSDIL